MKRRTRITLYILIVLACIIIGTFVIIRTTIRSDFLTFHEDVPAPTIVPTEEKPSETLPSPGSEIEPTKPTPTPEPEEETLAPVRIEIPSINVDAKVIKVGLTAKGAMATPTIYSSVGWYKYGTMPGETGSAVLAGHVDNGLALPGVFRYLVNVKIGDDIYVILSDKTRIHFTVADRAVYDYKEAPADLIFNRSDGKYLTLITCTGTLVRSEHTYDKRLVLTAVKAD
jgi:LPXTG-site transpeptidase (sortase) family protein